MSTAGARTFLILLCYGSLFFNTSASISSFVLIDRLGELQFRAVQKDQSILPSGGFTTVGAGGLLKRFGAGRLWTCIAWHCKLYSVLPLDETDSLTRGFFVFGWHLVYDFAGPDLHLVARACAYSNYYDKSCWLLYPATRRISRTIV